ncbi:MAG: ATP-dependent DNA helicase RecG [Treponema sp.]|nr:ATP-dependent DNA helicase RecG [Treponema sp.]
MLIRTIKAPLTSLKGIGPAQVPKFANLGIATVGDLLRHYPRDWEDRSAIVPLAEFGRAQVNTEVTVIASDWIGRSGGKFGRQRAILKIYVEDESARAALVCFNRPWLEKQLEVGRRFFLWGKFEYRYGDIQSSDFDIRPAESENRMEGIFPIYPLTEGLGQKNLHQAVGFALQKYANDIENELPGELITRYGLLQKSDAVKAIHFPESRERLELAKKTLVYEEFFWHQLTLKKSRARKKADTLRQSSACGSGLSPLQQRLIERLPFRLTAGQLDAVAAINGDMADTDFPMSRLLQGDVGSGKTLVSFMAALFIAEKGAQAALMAPTELLARQHAENAASLLEPLGLRIAYLTGNVKAEGRKELLQHLAAGEIDVVVGTHALFSKNVVYKNLKLAVIDEQHRFGVNQRSMIMEKGESPHLLMMSATPIPRTLEMTAFGDMDVSRILDMPPGRKEVKTHLAKGSESENRVYDFVRQRLGEGRQAYFVYPLIENSEETFSDLKDAVSMKEKLAKKVFPRFTVALVHSRLDEEERRRIMESFRAGEIKVLVATTVVEVGVDVPNASCMVIAHAERFGLSALHQLRGRVGRGTEQAYCFLIYSDRLTDEGKDKLKVMRETCDGFKIAEADLRLRGPGQITGTEQSGHIGFTIADPVLDIGILEKARGDAAAIYENDPDFALEDHRIIARVFREAPPFPAAVV